MQVLAGRDDLRAQRQSFPNTALDHNEMDGGIFQQFVLTRPSKTLEARVLLRAGLRAGIVFGNTDHLVIRRILHRLELSCRVAVLRAEQARLKKNDWCDLTPGPAEDAAASE